MSSCTKIPRYKHLTGTLKVWGRIGDTDKKVRNGYCDTCATHMWTYMESMPDVLSFRPGTLDGQEVLDSLPPFKETYAK